MKNMKWFFVLLAATVCGRAQVTNQIHSDVYAWKDAKVFAVESVTLRMMVNGAATDFASMDIRAITFMKGAKLVPPPNGLPISNLEEMIVVKDGSLKLTINGKAKTVGRGSVAIVRARAADSADGRIPWKRIV